MKRIVKRSLIWGGAILLVLLGGAAIVLAYGIQKRDPVIILGQALSFFIYFRNLALIAKERRERGKVAIEGEG